jgi:hypothetical protein
MWNRLTRSSLTTVSAVVLLAALGIYVSTASPQNQAPRKTKAFHATKDCSGFAGTVGSYCTIRSSNVKALKAGSKIFYVKQSSATTLDSDIFIYVGHGTAATGHCLLHLASGIGLCTISDGTGALAGFHLRVRVSADKSIQNLWHWDGMYGFGKG